MFMSQHKLSTWQRYLLLSMFVAVASSGFGIRSVSAQVPATKPYKSLSIVDTWKLLPTDPNEKATSPKNRDIKRRNNDIAKKQRGDQELFVEVLKGNLPLNQNREKFEDWFKGYVFPKMTGLDLESLTTLPTERKKFFSEYFVRIKPQPDGHPSTTAHDFFVQFTLDKMTFIANENFHPAVRYNAMMIIGQLNAKEHILGLSERPPTPLIQALAAMGKSLNSADQIDAVRVAALLGILRHAEIDGQLPTDKKNINPPYRSAIINLMLSLIASKPPQSRSIEGHVWMQRRAVDVLGAMGEVGESGKVAKELDRLVGDVKAPLSLRCNAATALSRLDISKVTTDFAENVRHLASLTSDACRAELARLEEENARSNMKRRGAGQGDYFEDPQYAGPAAGPAIPDGGAFDGIPGEGEVILGLVEKARIESLRRRLKYQLDCVSKGLQGSGKSGKGIAQVNTGPAKELVDAVVEGIGELTALTDIEKEKEDDEEAEEVLGDDGEKLVGLAKISKMILDRLERFEAVAGIEPSIPESTDDPAAPKAPGAPSTPTAPGAAPTAPGAAPTAPAAPGTP